MLLALVWMCALPPTVALLYFSVEVVLGLRRIPPMKANTAGLNLVVLVPAHNEELIIGETVRSLRAIVAPTTHMLIVADNCSDDTAKVARSYGAEVIERSDPSRKGKGYALAFARDYMSSDPPEAVLVLDADCVVSKGSAEMMAKLAVQKGEPMQSVNLLSAPQGASPLVLLSNFAMVIKNLVRARGLYRLGGGIPLFGTGMAFPWHLFSRLDLATADTVEDLRLSLNLAQTGIKVHLYEGLQVTSAAASLKESLGQRRRWEHGFLENASKYGLRSLVRGLFINSRHLGFLGAHLLVPPLALLALMAGLTFIPASLLAAFATNPWPLVLLAGALVTAIVATGLAWHREGRAVLGAGTLARAPFYVLWKIPLYLGFIFSRQREWNRTRRANEES